MEATKQKQHKQSEDEMNQAENIICDCGHPESPHSSITRGYGIDEQGKTFCYACCADNDRKAMRETGRICLYLTGDKIRGYKLTNWPGSFIIPLNHVAKGCHNIAGSRYDFRFTFEGQLWAGVQYGENTQIAHCRKLKKQTEYV